VIRRAIKRKTAGKKKSKVRRITLELSYRREEKKRFRNSCAFREIHSETRMKGAAWKANFHLDDGHETKPDDRTYRQFE